MPRPRVVVVGTTCDYVDLLRLRHPDRLFFLTDAELRVRAWEPDPGPGEEALADLRDFSASLDALERALAAADLRPSGIACYDCESLPLAAEAARRHGLPFASRAAVEAARSKEASKRLWRAAGVACPEGGAIQSSEELSALLSSIGLPVILKPLTGAGSELVFRADTREGAVARFLEIQRALREHADVRLYPEASAAGEPSARRAVGVERCVEGPEFSAEILLAPEGARLVRVAAKLAAPELGVGTARAYVVPAHGETGLGVEALTHALERAARALGFASGLCMADFIVEDGRPVFLELTPRPSGDCLPWLLLASGGLDTLGLALDLAEGMPPRLPALDAYEPLVGLRLFAPREGVVATLDTARLAADRRVRETRLYRRPGHRVVFPPADYASRVLGHALFAPTPGAGLQDECRQLAALLDVCYEETP